MPINLLKIILFSVLINLLIVTMPGVIQAQERINFDKKNNIGSIAASAVKAPIEEYTAIIPIDDQYVRTTFKNLSKLYWVTGKFDLNDLSAIDNYLVINECGLYVEFYNNEFEWRRIQTATQQYIKNSISDFPTEFEILIPIELGRYDMGKEVFYVKEETKFKSMRKMDVAFNNENIKICNKRGNIKNYPRNIILMLSRPFTLVEVPVNPELAELYMESVEEKVAHLPHVLKIRKYKRVAYLRLKVKIFLYKETTTINSHELRAVVMGTLKGIEIYADTKKMKLLYKKDVLNKRIRRKKKK